MDQVETLSRTSSTNSMDSSETINTVNSDKSMKNQLIEQCWSNLRDYKDGGEKAGKITNAMIYMIAKDDLPLSVTEKDGFKKLMKLVAPHYTLPSRMTIGNLIDEKYQYLAAKLKDKILQVTSVSLTTDIWTDLNMRSFLGLTVHFIEETKFQCFTLGVFPLDERHCSEYLGRIMKDVCDNWNITPEKVIAVVADNAANITKSISNLYGRNKYLPCFAHTLDLIATKPCKDLEIVKDLIQKVKDIVSYFNHSVLAMDELRKAQGDMQVPLKLIQSVCTRWNSTFYQLERFLLLSDKIAPILLKNSKAPVMLTATSLEAVKDLIEVFRPIEALTKEISGEKYVTASKIIPMVHCLTESIESFKPTTDVGIAAKTLISNEISKRFGAVEHVNILADATFLDPRFKKLYFKDRLACSHVIARVKELLSNKQNRNEVEGNSSNSPDTPAKNTHSIWKFHSKLVSEHYQEQEPSDRGEMPLALKSYILEPVSDLESTDPITFWSLRRQQALYEKLSELALQSLCVVGTSVPSERLFSRTGNIISHERNRLSGDRLNHLVFLKSLEDWNI